MTYLSDAVRARPNLTIRSETLADRVEIDNGRARAVILADGSRLAAGQIVLSAGAYGSAAICCAPASAPQPTSRRWTSPSRPICPSAGACRNIPSSSPSGRRTRNGWPAHSAGRRDPVDPFIARRTGRRRPARQRSALRRSRRLPTGAIFMLALALTRPRSTGTLKLVDRDPRTAPLIDLNILGSAQDRELMVEGIQLIRRIASQGPLSEIIAQELVPGPTVTAPAALEAALPDGARHLPSPHVHRPHGR